MSQGDYESDCGRDHPLSAWHWRVHELADINASSCGETDVISSPELLKDEESMKATACIPLLAVAHGSLHQELPIDTVTGRQ